MPGGFNHYEQSLRIVDVLENDRHGLNLTWEVRDGIARHSKGKHGMPVGAPPEHRASTIVARLFARVSARFAHRGPSRGTIVIGGPSGERHGLALTMVADLLRSRGWNVSDIGPDMPAESFATAVQNIDQLRAVCVGVTLRESLPAAKSVIAAVNRVVPTDVMVYVGGAAVTSDADAQQLGADTWAKDPRTLVTLLSQTD